METSTDSVRETICELLDEGVDVIRTLHQMGSSIQILIRTGRYDQVNQHLSMRSKTLSKLVQIDKTLYRLFRKVNGNGDLRATSEMEAKLAKVRKLMESVRETDRMNKTMLEEVCLESQNFLKRNRDRSILKRSAYCVRRKGYRRASIRA